MENNHWGVAVGGLLLGLVLGATGGYYYALTQQPKAAATETPQAAENPYAEVETNPYSNVKVNPFE